jgi:glycosyltransferase involved in cell wall biosynthesis
MKMCEAFANSGAEEILVVPKRRNFIKSDPFQYYTVRKNFSLVKLLCVDLSATSESKIVFFTRIFSFIFFLKFFLFFKKFDIVYTREWIVAKYLKNFCLEIHSLPKEVKRGHIKVWKRAKCLVVLTSHIKNKMVENGISAGKILVAGDAVNIKEFEVRKNIDLLKTELELPKEKKMVGYVGSLKTMSMEKGVSCAISAMARLDDSYLLCVVGGEQKDIDFYKNFAKERNLSEKVLFVGNVKHEKVPLYMKAMDILVAPFPVNDHYSFYMSPLKIFEYMASGKPIVASDLPSIREVLNESNSILIKPADDAELAEAVKKLSEDKIFADKIASVALSDVQNYTWQKRAKKILEFAVNQTKP